MSENQEKQSNPKNDLDTLELFSRTAQTVDKLEKDFSNLANNQLRDTQQTNIFIRAVRKHWGQVVLVITVLFLVVPKTIQISWNINEAYNSFTESVEEFNEQINTLVVHEQEKIDHELEKIGKEEETIRKQEEIIEKQRQNIEVLKEILKELQDDDQNGTGK